MKLWDETESQFCDECGLYHYRNDCSDAYFNAPENWTPSKTQPRASAASAMDRYRKRFA